MIRTMERRGRINVGIGRERRRNSSERRRRRRVREESEIWKGRRQIGADNKTNRWENKTDPFGGKKA